jgi:hypothetical protein
MAQITPNQFELRGAGLSVSYSASGLSGKPQLTFTKRGHTLTFMGDEIGVADTQVGALITVTIATRVDRDSTTFSFLLPAIQMSDASSKEAFRTIGITTIHKTTIAGPPNGVQETYKTTELRGVARAVEFLTRNTAGA